MLYARCKRYQQPGWLSRYSDYFTSCTTDWATVTRYFKCPAGLCGSPGLLLNAYRRRLFHGGKATGAWSWKLTLSGAVSHARRCNCPPYVFTIWCVIKQRDKFTVFMGGKRTNGFVTLLVAFTVRIPLCYVTTHLKQKYTSCCTILYYYI
jgi:hypothetical protein